MLAYRVQENNEGRRHARELCLHGTPDASRPHTWDERYVEARKGRQVRARPYLPHGSSVASSEKAVNQKQMVEKQWRSRCSSWIARSLRLLPLRSQSR